MSVGVPTQTVPQNEPTPGSLPALMDALVAVQQQVPTHPALAGFDEGLNLKRWRPEAADTPMLYNWLLEGANERKDIQRVRDVVGISTRIGITVTPELDARMRFVEYACDAYRAVVDAAFWSGMRMRQPLAAAATWAMRSSFRSFYEEIGGTPVVGIEFIQSFWLDHAA